MPTTSTLPNPLHPSSWPVPLRASPSPGRTCCMSRGRKPTVVRRGRAYRTAKRTELETSRNRGEEWCTTVDEVGSNQKSQLSSSVDGCRTWMKVRGERLNSERDSLLITVHPALGIDASRRSGKLGPLPSSVNAWPCNYTFVT